MVCTPALRDSCMRISTKRFFVSSSKQRYQGIKNEKGVYVTPAFPKLIYVLDENNCLKGGKYDYLTKLAVKCSSKRLYPDYISAKKMREYYEGNVFSPMGCRSFLSPWKDLNGLHAGLKRFLYAHFNKTLFRFIVERVAESFVALLNVFFLCAP